MRFRQVDEDKKTGEEIYNGWVKLSAKEIKAKMDHYHKSKGTERAGLDYEYENGCMYYSKTHDNDIGEDTAVYKFCCELLNYCAWYNQAWFQWTCIAVGALILICLITICICYCCCNNRRNSYGKELEDNYEEEKEESESKSTVNEEGE